MKKLIQLIICASLINLGNAQENGIINNSKSPHVKLKSIDIGDCQWTEGFWADKFKVAEEIMIPHMGELLKGDIGFAYNNFKIAAGLKEGEHQGMKWHDGDFYKWMEAAIYIYANNGDQKILKDLDEIIDVIEKAMAEDGYLSTYIMLKNKERYEVKENHELYNSGHLLTSACIHYRVTGKSNFLDLAIKHADFLYRTFQPKPNDLARFGVNPSQIMGLVELYRTTKDPKYLELAGIFIDMRGTNRENGLARQNVRNGGDSNQDRVPFRKETKAIGHAVMAMYLYNGAADIYSETGEEALLNSLDRLWKNIAVKTYVTGAVGQRHHGASQRSQDAVHEAFIDEYMMPNTTAYNETCANIANAMFNWRMLSIKAESKHADIVETVLYNSALSGISIDGKNYFYTNPLRRTCDSYLSPTDSETRTPYIKCFCCPPNLVRTIAKVSGWAYSKAENGIAVNLYGGNKLNTKMEDGSAIELIQETKYPWEGMVKITIQKCKKEAFDVMLRIPDWAQGTTLNVNGSDSGVDVKPGNFATINRKWKKSDVITLDMPMEINMLEGNPLIEEVRNQAAIKRGPVVYCMENNDLPEETSILDVYLPLKSKFNAEYRPNFLGGLTSISGEVKLRKDKGEGMYRKIDDTKWESFKTQFVPYYAWSNRGKSEMTIWLPIVWE